MKVVRLTSAAQWDPENLNGNNFLSGADLHYAHKLTNHITDKMIVDDEKYYDTSDLEPDEMYVTEGFFCDFW